MNWCVFTVEGVVRVWHMSCLASVIRSHGGCVSSAVALCMHLLGGKVDVEDVARFALLLAQDNSVAIFANNQKFLAKLGTAYLIPKTDHCMPFVG